MPQIGAHAGCVACVQVVRKIFSAFGPGAVEKPTSKDAVHKCNDF